MCNYRKLNQCTEKYHKVQCGNISWEESKDADGNCSCDASSGYAPVNKQSTCFVEHKQCFLQPCELSADGYLQEMLQSINMPVTLNTPACLIYMTKATR